MKNAKEFTPTVSGFVANVLQGVAVSLSDIVAARLRIGRAFGILTGAVPAQDAPEDFKPMAASAAAAAIRKVAAPYEALAGKLTLPLLRDMLAAWQAREDAATVITVSAGRTFDLQALDVLPLNTRDRAKVERAMQRPEKPLKVKDVERTLAAVAAGAVDPAAAADKLVKKAAIKRLSADEQLVAAAKKVERLREQLAAAEAELAKLQAKAAKAEAKAEAEAEVAAA